MSQKMRSDYCGTLRAADADREVSLCGWVARRREHGEHLAFIDLRDHTGIVQCVVEGAADLRSEYVVRITGKVRVRPADTANADLPTGEIEVGAENVEILSAAEPPPFPLDERTDVDETLRLRHRYLDLRRAPMQHNMRTRAKVNSALRQAMEEQGFVEIETPMLIASTPEGARDFVVPSRLHPGNFYALPQSPQIFKQLCMVGGLDRYYQIARCLRDEDLRADRQFEFLQLDAEMSFAGQEEVFECISHAVAAATEAVTGERPTEFPRMPWREAMERFGSDKPDTRFGMELVELTPLFSATEFKVFQAPSVKGIRIPGGAADVTRKRLDELTEDVKRWGGKGLVWMRVEEDELNSPVAKFLTDDEAAGLRTAMEAEVGDLLFIVADEWKTTVHLLGLLRLAMGRPSLSEGPRNFLWITEFPLFEEMDGDRPIPMHHPFTMPHVDDLELLDPAGGEALLDVRSQSYDLVMNGWELGSGSVRIHRPDIQSQIFTLLGIGPEEAEAKFGFLLDAFRYGAPPHAGFAFGTDRLTALLVGEENIREVIAFPKTQSGADPLTKAPSPLDPVHLNELGLRVLPPAT